MIIEKVDTNCGCLAAQRDRQQIAPGATGFLSATLTPGNHRGLLKKSLFVRFATFPEPVEVLAEIAIPSTVLVSEQQLTWTGAGAAPKPDTRTVDVTSGDGTAFQITGLVGVPETRFSIEQKTITPGQHYQILITPANPSPPEAVSAALQIRTNSPNPRDQVIILFLNQAGKSP